MFPFFLDDEGGLIMNRTMNVLMCLTACILFAVPAQAGTVGLWLMDRLVDVTPPAGDPEIDPPGGETLTDSSGNGFDFVTATNFATLSLTSDVPAVMPSGARALDSNVAAAGATATPTTTLLSRGVTGEMTVEFWWKAVAPEPAVAYVLNFGDAADTGRWAIYREGGKLNFFETSNGFTTIATPSVASGQWEHIAFTISTAGVQTAYVNGIQVAQSAASGLSSPPFSSELHLGGNDFFGFGDHRFLIDELRVSNVALLPGNGTGIGELAWNAALVPEPSSLVLLALGSLMLFKRRR
jgi:hypothetical protein